MPFTIKDIYFFLVVLYSGLSLTFFRSNEGLLVLWLIGLFIFNNEVFYLRIRLLLALGVWVGYFIISTFLIGSFHPMFLGSYIAKIMIACWLLNYYKEEIFLKFENVIYLLTVISLFFYAIQLIVPEPMFQVFKSIDLSGNLFPNKFYASIGIYTFHQFDFNTVFPRNAGFTWEPGPFSSYVSLALFFNIARNGVKIKDTKRLSVFLLAIVTSQSTTGIMILLAIVLWVAWSSFNDKYFRMVSVPIALAIVIFLFVNVPWLQEKIISESEQNIEEVIDHARKSGKSYAPGRFASFMLRWEDFKKYPIAGYGGNSSLQTGYLGEGNVVAAINGIGGILGHYGAIGSILFLWLIFKTGKWLARFYDYSGHLIFPILILMIGFGFAIIESPLIVTLWLTPVFLPKAINQS